MEHKKRTHVFISGRVQGVYFRDSTKAEAQKRGVTGWVKNLSDGRVEAIFEGGEREVAEMVQWCHSGPPGAVVTEVEVRQEAYSGQYSAFVVERAYSW